jgi:hypothetical protein
LERLQQFEANLAAFKRQIAKPFEHESRLKELLAKQAELDAALDLHKSDEQAAAAAGNESEEITAG